MARVSLVACLSAFMLGACPDNPYVIGRLDAGPEGPVDAAVPSVPEASHDGGTRADGSVCGGPLAGALLCTDFESSDLRADFDAVERGGTGVVEHTTTRAHGGKGALRAASNSAESHAIVVADLPPLRTGTLFLRTFVYVPSGLATAIMNFAFVGDGSPVAPFEGIDLNLEAGALQVFSPQNPQRNTATGVLPRDLWVCLRAHVTVSDTVGSVQLFVDQQRVLSTNTFDTLPTDGINQVRLGIDWSSQQSSPFEIFFDDVVVDTSEVGCF